MRNRVFVLTLALLIVLCSSFSVFGATVINVAMNKPPTSDNQGYIVLSSDGKNAQVFYWNISPYSASSTTNNVSAPSVSLVLNNDSVQFTANHTGSARWTLTRVGASSGQSVVMSQSFTTSSSYTYTGLSDINYYQYAGNIGVVDDNISSSNNYLSVRWGGEGGVYDNIADIESILSTIDGDTSAIRTQLSSVLTELEDIDADTSAIRTTINNINTKLTTISNSVSNIEGTVEDVYDNVVLMLTQLQNINSRLSIMQVTLDRSYAELTEISDSLVLIDEKLDYLILSETQEDTTSLDNSSIGSLGSLEDNIIFDATSALDSLSFNFGDGFTLVWDMISQAWQSNSKVFTIVTMCLTVGALKLILNR